MGIEFVQSGFVSTGLTLEAGNNLDLDVLAGGTANAIVVDDHGEEIVSGLAFFTIVNSGGNENLSSGGVASDSTINAGGQLELLGGGTVFDTVVNGGVIGGVGPGGATVGTLLLSSGSENVDSGGAAYDTIVSSGGHLYVQPVGSASGITVASGGYAVVQTSATATGVTLSGGTFEVQAGGVVDGGIAFAAGGDATLEIDGSTMPRATISAFAAGDAILLATLPASVTYDAADHLATLAGGQTISFDPATAPSALGYDPSTGLLFEPVAACFAAGTRIATARGAIPVEDLREGEQATLARGGSAPIVWLGHRRVACARHPRPWDVRPVRVRAGAFAEAVPVRDLILSPDHAVYAEGVLIPVRYLLNGATVVQEAAEAVSYWHVELPAHDVLLAEGLPTESYLDTGNRAAFGNGGPAVQAHPDFSRAVWERAGCARLVTGGPAVMRARRRLLRRAAALGYRPTRNAALAVVADGRALPSTADGARRKVVLPDGVGTVRLVSRSFEPAHRRAAASDTRMLGVAIGRVALDGLGLALDDPALTDGWHAPEPDWRWTDGAASIAVRGARCLEFDVAIVGSYWIAPSGDRGARPRRRTAP